MSGGPLDLPELVPTLLDEAGVDRFFMDIAFETTVVAILLRGDAVDRAEAAAPSLRVAREAFRSGRVTGVQVHYVHGGVDCWDTLVRTDAGPRLVRVKK